LGGIGTRCHLVVYPVWGIETTSDEIHSISYGV
jgi:hypothetical protein